MSELILVPPDKIFAVMPDVQPLLVPAIELSDGRWDIWSVAAQLLLGHMHLWISVENGKPEAAMVTRFVDYPKMRVLSIPFLGGKAMDNWMQFEPQISTWGKAQGAVELEGYARAGFKRVLKDWVFGWTFIRKPL